MAPAHAVAAGRLPRLSGDPFDRMLAAQALIENATILTRDPLVAAYGPVVACSRAVAEPVGAGRFASPNGSLGRRRWVCALADVSWLLRPPHRCRFGNNANAPGLDTKLCISCVTARPNKLERVMPISKAVRSTRSIRLLGR